MRAAGGRMAFYRRLAVRHNRFEHGSCARGREEIVLLAMRVDIVNETEGAPNARNFPPAANWLDLRENPRAIEAIEPVRRHPPLRTFLAALNAAESPFISGSVRVQRDTPAGVAAGEACEFASEVCVALTEEPHRSQWKSYSNLAAQLKELLERDAPSALHAILRISPCKFREPGESGFCLDIRLLAGGDSATQAEMRWGLGLARLQQALLFSARTLRTKT